MNFERRRRGVPPPPEVMEYAGRMLDDGASFKEVTRTTYVSREYLAVHFPGKGWTYKQAGEFRALLRDTKPKQKEQAR